MLLALLGAALAAEAPSVDEPLRTGSRTPADAAIVVGNEDYASLPDVPYAARDAQVFYDWLVYTRGLPPDQAHLLVNGSHAAIRESIKSAAAEVKAGGTLWIYFAGHGTAVPTGSDGETERALVGKSAEADARTFADFTLSLSEVEDIAVASRAAEVVIVLDACYMNATRSGEALVAGRPMVPVYALQSRDRVTVWSGAGPSEVAGPYEPARHGLFTYLLVGGLRGWADGELGAVDGAVSSDELKAWTSRSVRQVGQNSQTPELVGGPKAALAKKLPVDRVDPAGFPRAGGSNLQDRLDALKREQGRLEQEAAEQVRQATAARTRRVGELRSRARTDWRATQALAEGGGPTAEEALMAYIETYADARDSFEESSIAVTIPEVTEAQAELERIRRAGKDRGRGSRVPLVVSGGAGFALGGALLGVGWAREQSLLSMTASGDIGRTGAASLRTSTNAIYGAGYGLAGVGGLLTVLGFTRPDSATVGSSGCGLTWSTRW